MFLDYGYQKGRFSDKDGNLFGVENDFVSFGTEITADMHNLRFPFPVNMGFRIGYEEQTKGMFADFLLTVSLDSY